MTNQNSEFQKDDRLSRIAEGKHAHVVGSGNPGTIFKITRCPETVELLRRLKSSPIMGLPEVLGEIDSSDITQYAKDKLEGKNVVCFEIVKYYNIKDTPKELAITKEFLKKYIKEPSTANPIKILKDGSQQLKNEGYYQFSNVIEYLIAFLADRPKAYLVLIQKPPKFPGQAIGQLFRRWEFGWFLVIKSRILLKSLIRSIFCQFVGVFIPPYWPFPVTNPRQLAIASVATTWRRL